MHLFDRKLQDLFRDRTVLEKWIIFFACLLTCTFFVVAIMKVRGDGIFAEKNVMCVSDECIVAASSIMKSINVDVQPCDNFYEFACGKWQQNHEVQSEVPENWFVERSKNITKEITKILENNDSPNDLHSVREARRLYRSCMDISTINSIQYEPVFVLLEKVGLPRMFPDFTTATYLNGTSFNVARTLALIQRYLGVDILLQLGMDVNPNTNLAAITIGPVTTYTSPLPEPLYDYHNQYKFGYRRPFDVHRLFDEIEFKKRIAVAKLEYMVKVITTMVPNELLNLETLIQSCLKVLTLEIKLLNTDVDYEIKPEEFTTSGLMKYMYSNSSDPLDDRLFDWQSFIDHFTTESNAQWTMNDVVLVRKKEYLLELQWMLIDIPLYEIQQLLWWRVVESLVLHTTNHMVDLKADYYERVIETRRVLTRQEFCTSVAKSILKFPIAYEFYTHHDIKDTTAKVFEMVSQLQDELKNMISESDWMDDKSKELMLNKLDSLKIGVGYPKIFETPQLLDQKYSYINIMVFEYLQSILNIKTAEVGQILEQLGKPAAKLSAEKQVLTDPLEVNAFYNRMDNSINIPAGILQTPFFYKGNDVVNYGAIGTVIGHEITHGIDIEGINYDIHGHKAPQWTPDSERQYLLRALCFVDQYDNFKINLYTRLNGTRTLGENMADNVGLKQSWKAYKSNKIGRGSHLPGLTKYTNDQLFFLSYANLWCRVPSTKNDETLQSILNDEHSPSTARVLGSLRNSPDFAEVWNCPAGSPMNPTQKCTMW